MIYTYLNIFVAFYYWFLSTENNNEFSNNWYYGYSAILTITFLQCAYIFFISLILFPDYITQYYSISLAAITGSVLLAGNISFYNFKKSNIYTLVKEEYINNDKYTNGKAPVELKIGVALFLGLLVTIVMVYAL